MTPEEHDDDWTGVRVEVSNRGKLTWIDDLPVPGISDMSREEFDDFIAVLKAKVDEWFEGRRRDG